jgi:hypothetical protein
MLTNNEQVTLHILSVAAREGLRNHIHVSYDDRTGLFTTSFDNHQTFADNPFDPSHDLTTLEDAAILYEAQQEVINNEPSAPAWQDRSHALSEIFLSRILKKNIELPYHAITYKNWSVPSTDILPVFSQKEEESGKLLLNIIKLAVKESSGFNSLDFYYTDAQWSNREHKYVSVPETLRFETKVLLGDYAELECDQEIQITEDNYDMFEDTWAEITGLYRKNNNDDNSHTRLTWAGRLFALKTDKITTRIKDVHQDTTPDSLLPLFTQYPQYDKVITSSPIN